MRNVRVAAIQMQCAKDVATNIQTAERLVRQAAEQGAQIILLHFSSFSPILGFVG